MNRNLKVSKSIEINSIAEKVWDVLINPDKIKAYLFGTEKLFKKSYLKTLTFLKKQPN